MSTKIQPLNAVLTYMGRIELYGGFPRFVFAGTSVTIRFKGTDCACVIRNHRFYNEMSLGVVIDGKVTRVDFEHKDEDIRIVLAEGLENTDHELTLYKRQDATHYFEFKGFELDDCAELLPAKPVPKRRMECFGDSVSCGAVTEAIERVGAVDPDGHDGIYDNSWYAFPFITARNLGAQLNDTSQGGIAIFDKTGWYHAPDYIGMETAYNKVCYFPEAEGGYTNWDFRKFIPHVVLFAVGQNDQHNEEPFAPDIENKEFRERWKAGYKKIILDLRSKYPNALFVLLLTVLYHDKGWDDAIDEIAAELKDPKIKHFMFTRTGKATPGHPRIPEQYEMAEELTAYLSNMGESIWE